MRNLVFIGGPGSGKGTHAAELSKQLGVLHISTGNLYRQEMVSQTPLGIEAKKLLDRGQLGTDEMTETLLRRRLAEPDARRGFILDGFPRTLPQTTILERILQERGQRLDLALFLRITDASIVERLSGRLTCERCQKSYHIKYNPPRQAGLCDVCGGALIRRDDDQPATIRERLRVFHARTEPILAYYRQQDLLVAVDADGEVTEVSARIERAVREFFSRRDVADTTC